MSLLQSLLDRSDKVNQKILEFHDSPVLSSAVLRILNAKRYGSEYYEHHVSTLVCTILPTIFSINAGFVITPEQIQDGRRRPDFTIEKESPRGIGLMPHVLVEVKKYHDNPDSIEAHFKKAREQATNTVTESLDNMVRPDLSIFIIIVCGLDFRFYEYYNFQDLLKTERVENDIGLIPLARPHPNDPPELKELQTKALSVPRDIGNNDAALQGDKDITFQFSYDDQESNDLIRGFMAYMMYNDPRVVCP